jgi:predicted dehydrogenase
MPKTWTVGVVGSTGKGNYGHGLDTAWNAVESTQIVAVADDNANGLANAAKKLKVDKAYLSYEEMLDKVRPDIVAVCPRWIDQHFAIAMAAIQRGIHVYMEKPLCRNLREADALVDACTKNKVKLAIAHPTRYSPKLKTIRQLISAGEIGQVLEYRGRGKEDRRGGGEDLWVLGTHVLDMIHALGGKPKWCQATVWWKGERVSKKDVFAGPEGIGPLAGDEVQAMYGMQDGSTAYFSSKRNNAGKPPRYGLQIHGSKGIIELLEATMPSVKFLGDTAWSPGRTGSKWQDVSSAGIGKPEPLNGSEYTARHTIAIRDFVKAIEQNRAPLGNVQAGRDVTEMIAAVFESHRTEGPVELPLKTRANPLTLLR